MEALRIGNGLSIRLRNNRELFYLSDNSLNKPELIESFVSNFGSWLETVIYQRAYSDGYTDGLRDGKNDNL